MIRGLSVHRAIHTCTLNVFLHIFNDLFSLISIVFLTSSGSCLCLCRSLSSCALCVLSVFTSILLAIVTIMIRIHIICAWWALPMTSPRERTTLLESPFTALFTVAGWHRWKREQGGALNVFIPRLLSLQTGSYWFMCQGQISEMQRKGKENKM